MIKRIKKFFAKKWAPNQTYQINGLDLYWSDFDRGRVCGHSYMPKVDDAFECKMSSGKIGVFRIKKVDCCGDPRNMWFATVEGVGYKGEV